MKKLSARWVPQMLTPEQKACHQQFSEENLDMPRANPENLFSRIITGDETWVHHYDPETKLESMQWKHKGSTTPKKFWVQQSSRMIMQQFFGTQKVFFFWNSHKTTITGDTYASIMMDLRDSIKQKRRGKLSAGVLLHDNAPAHKSRTSRTAIRKCGIIELNHPPYSPSLAPSGYFHFRNL